MSVETVTPTEAERERASRIVIGYRAQRGLSESTWTDAEVGAIDAIAQALAEQRAEIVGRYEALADELDRLRPKDRDKHPYAAGRNDAAERIRSVAR